MLSIIIPTLNEAASLATTIAHTLRAACGTETEIIVSDCGSGDGTAALARSLDADVVLGGRCRADALNIGASAADGDTLLFLHADSLLPDEFPHLIARALGKPLIVGGAFDFEFSKEPETGGFDAQCLRWVVLVNRIRYRWTGNFYGDQAIFVRRDVFRRVGGFPNVRLMEDIRFSRRLRRFGRTAILRPPVRTSPRRFLSHGVIRQFVEDLTLLGCDSIGVCPVKLWERYNGWNRCAARSQP
jgi:rSAM/selenodomain-associated transferase 2